jgi:intraflagellar transport protein 80
MRFKIKKFEKNKHGDIVTAVSWNASNELISASEDLTIYKWDLNGEPVSKLLDLDIPCIDIDWFPSSRSGSELLAIGCTNGSIKLMSKSGRIEKSVENTHSGSITCIKWTNDGAALATAGEDGAIKIWSKNIELRSALLQVGKPVYCLVWSPDNNSLLYCSSTNITIMPTVVFLYSCITNSLVLSKPHGKPMIT